MRRIISGCLSSALAIAMTGLGIAGPTATPKAAAQTPSADVLFVFDTTGSMSGALAGAKAQVLSTMDSVRSQVPDINFAVAQIRDSGDSPAWELTQAVTSDASRIQAAIDSYYADGGGDLPEAYGSALFAASQDSIGWRPGAKHLVVLVNDDVPHDNDLNQGVPIASQTINPGGIWSTGTDVVANPAGVDWQDTLSLLKSKGIVFSNVIYSGSSSYIPYWTWWTGLTGGVTTEASTADQVGDALVKAISGSIAGKKVVMSFGDSIAAGEGSGAHLGYPDNPKAYGGVIGSKLGWQSYNFAISGACSVTAGPGAATGTPAECQKSILTDEIPLARAMGLKPDLITVTVGGNDIRFVECIGEVLGVDGTLLGISSGCTGQVFTNRVKALQTNLAKVVKEIRATWGPDVPIAVTGYGNPMPFPVLDGANVSDLMQDLTLAKALVDAYTGTSGSSSDKSKAMIKAGVQTLRDLDNKSVDYQTDVYVRALRILGQLNDAIQKASQSAKAQFVGLSFIDHDVTTDFGAAQSYVLAPKIHVFFSYYGTGIAGGIAGGDTFEQNFDPAHRCTPIPRTDPQGPCDTTTFFSPANWQGDWNGLHGTAVIAFWSNDFPHLTVLGQSYVADRVIEALNLK